MLITFYTLVCLAWTVHTVLNVHLCECMYLFVAHIFSVSAWHSRLQIVV